MTDLPKMQAEADRIDLQLFNAVMAIEEFYDKFEPYLQLKDRQALQKSTREDAEILIAPHFPHPRERGK